MQPTKLLAVALCVVFVVGCSTPPKSPVTAPTSHAQAAVTSSTENGPAGAQSGTSGVINTSLIKEGYRAVRRKNQILYCRSETVTGSSLPYKVCLTESQAKDQEQKNKDSKEFMNRPTQSGACSGAECSR
jgi:hypothetical protein